MDIESDSAVPVVDIRKGITLATKVYSKPTHTGQYLNLKSNHLPHAKEVYFRVFTIVLPPDAKNMVCLIKLAA
jgi:hypothetical protein